MKYVLCTLLLVGGALCVAACRIIPSFVFHPTKTIVAVPSDIGLDYEDVRLRTLDGETLAAWHIPAAPDAAGPGRGSTVLFLHGNAGNISHRLESIAFFHALGLSVFIVDYRGFGESTGKPSVDGTVVDARAAWEWLTGRKSVPASRIIVFGRSLGGGVAAALAARVTPQALILESTFTSLHDVGKKTVPLLPKFLFLQEYETGRNIKDLRVPLLVVHSPDDEVIDYRMGRKIFEDYSGPKSFSAIRGSHNGGWLADREAYEKGVRAFLETLPSEGAAY